MFEIGFVFVTEGCDPAKDRARIESENIIVNIVGCPTYSVACQEAKKLSAAGCCAIELCPAFGNKGVAYVQDAVGPDVPVGVVKFDLVPAFGHKSGDTLFDDIKGCAKEPVMGSPCGKRESCDGCPKKDTCPVRAAAMASSAADEYDLKTWMKTIK